MKNLISKGTLAQPSGARLCPEGVTCIQEKLNASAGNGAFPVVCNWGRDGPPFPGPTPKFN